VSPIFSPSVRITSSDQKDLSRSAPDLAGDCPLSSNSDHRLHRRTPEVRSGGALNHGSLDRSEGDANLGGGLQIQFYASHIGLVSDRFRMQLDDHWIAECLRCPHRFVLRVGDVHWNPGNAATRR
jgi:hypothetical protein